MKWLILAFLFGVVFSAPFALRVKLTQPTVMGTQYASYPWMLVCMAASIDIALVYHYAFSSSPRVPIIVGVLVFVDALIAYIDYEATHAYLPRSRGNMTGAAVVILVVLANAAAISLQYVHPAHPSTRTAITRADVVAPALRPSS